MDSDNTSKRTSPTMVKPDHDKDRVRILPCALRAYNFFEAVFHLSKSLRTLSSNTEIFFSGFIVQRAIFDNGCKSLMLLVAPTRQDVEDMLEDQNHHIWTNETAEEHLGQRLGSARSSCSRILQSIVENLDITNRKLQPFAKRYTGDRKAKLLFKLMGTKSSSNLGTHISRFSEELGQLNDLFRCCILQAVPPSVNDLIDLPQFTSEAEASLRQKEGKIAKERELDAHISDVQEALQSLLESLSSEWPCQDRSVHSYSVYLDLESLRDFRPGSNEHIRFNLAVSVSPHEETCWLVVHSTQGEYCFCQQSDREFSLGSLYSEDQACKGTISATSKDAILSPNVEVHPSTQGPVNSSSANNKCPSSERGEYPDLSLTEDLCTYLQKSKLRWRSSVNREETPCLGYLKTSGILSHLNFHVQNVDILNGLFSLDRALLRAQDSHFAISTEDKLRLASLLATAIFQLDQTQWLLKGWSSKEIYFFQSDQYNGKTDLQKPFLRRHIQGNDTEDSDCEITSLIITNSQPFALCLILLELAFSSPLRKLELPEKIAKDLSNSERDHLKMTWLVETVEREVGSRYATVVRYCYFHSFGSRELLSIGKPSKSHQISADIVSELNRCLLAWLMKPAI